MANPPGNAFHVTLAGIAATGLNFGNFLNQEIAPVQVNANLFGSGTNPDANTAYIRGLYFASVCLAPASALGSAPSISNLM